MLDVNEHMGLKLFRREIIFEEFKPIWTRYLIVSDRQTDRRTDRRTTYCHITALCTSTWLWYCRQWKSDVDLYLYL